MLVNFTRHNVNAIPFNTTEGVMDFCKYRTLPTHVLLINTNPISEDTYARPGNFVLMHNIEINNKMLLESVRFNIDYVDCYPTSTNKLFLQGTLDYCKYAIKLTLVKQDKELNKLIKKYCETISKLYSRLPSHLFKVLSIDGLKCDFSIIEEKCTINGIMPSLNEITLEFLAKNNLLD